MSDYKRGKGLVEAWERHWDAVANVADSRTTTEAKMMEYGQPIRVAFTEHKVPDILLMAMPPYVRKAHRAIMELPVHQRECIIVWHFGDDDERLSKFGIVHKEPKRMVGIYRKLGRRLS